MVACALFNSKTHSSDRPVYEGHMIKKNIYNTDHWHADHNPVTHSNIDFGNLIADLSYDKRAAIALQLMSYCKARDQLLSNGCEII